MMANSNKLALANFKQTLKEIESTWVDKGFLSESQQPLLDITTLMLRIKIDQIKQLEKDIQNYSSPHFTNEYRVLEGHCSKLQTDLDALDISGREELRRERKEALMRVGQLATELGSKTHADGQSCAECKI